MRPSSLSCRKDGPRTVHVGSKSFRRGRSADAPPIQLEKDTTDRWLLFRQWRQLFPKPPDCRKDRGRQPHGWPSNYALNKIARLRCLHRRVQSQFVAISRDSARGAGKGDLLSLLNFQRKCIRRISWEY